MHITCDVYGSEIKFKLESVKDTLQDKLTAFRAELNQVTLELIKYARAKKPWTEIEIIELKFTEYRSDRAPTMNVQFTSRYAVDPINITTYHGDYRSVIGMFVIMLADIDSVLEPAEI